MKRALLLLALVAGTAHAESKADKLFAKGKKLLAQKKYQEACAAFEQSDQLDPGIGTKLNVARCFEEWGKIASALRWYQDAEQMAKDHKDPRAEKIKGLEEAIDSDVPRLTIKSGDSADTAGLTLDGAATKVNVALPVDPGPHELVWTTSAGEKKSKSVPLERGGSSEVKVDLPKKKKKPKGDKRGEEVEDEKPPVVAEGDGRSQRLAGLVVGGAGVVAVGVASVLTVQARSKYNDALATHCMNDRTMCDDVGLASTADARHRANISTGIAIVGVAAIGTGVILYLIAPHGTPAAKSEHAFYLVPEVDGDGATVLLGGRF